MPVYLTTSLIDKQLDCFHLFWHKQYCYGIFIHTNLGTHLCISIEEDTFLIVKFLGKDIRSFDRSCQIVIQNCRYNLLSRVYKNMSFHTPSTTLNIVYFFSYLRQKSYLFVWIFISPLGTILY